MSDRALFGVILVIAGMLTVIFAAGDVAGDTSWPFLIIGGLIAAVGWSFLFRSFRNK